MRNAWQGQSLIRNESGALIGFSTGFDFVSEHEWGTDEIDKALGIRHAFDPKDPDTKICVHDTNRANPLLGNVCTIDELVKEWDQNGSISLSGSILDVIDLPGGRIGIFLIDRMIAYRATDMKGKLRNNLRKCIVQEAPTHYQDEVASRWCSSEFFFSVNKTDETKKFLNSFLQRLYEGKVFKGLTSPSWTSGDISGLVFLDVDEFSEEDYKGVMAERLEQCDIWKKVHDSDIFDLLNKADCKYYALSRPHFNEEGELIMWLNPMEQRKYNFGWFTIADLRLWAEGKGPIMMENNE